MRQNSEFCRTKIEFGNSGHNYKGLPANELLRQFACPAAELRRQNSVDAQKARLSVTADW